jgi:carboxyl-terminal processing protease
MKRRLIYSVLITVLVFNVIFGTRLYVHTARAADADTDSAYPSLELFTYVLEKVRNEYVDGKKLTYQDLVYGALKGMINTLDPHSEFMAPTQYDELTKDTEGKFGGLGIMIDMRDGFVTVVAPMEDTPGSRAGILAGDRIIKIDGASAEKLGVTDAVDKLRGDPGTEVTITIMRPSTGEVKDLKLKREEIKVDMVKDLDNKRDFPLLQDKIGYVRLVQFGESTSDELERALRHEKSEGMQALIVDLRNNPGGLLDQAIAVCSKFLHRGVLVVSTEGRNPGPDTKLYNAVGSGDEIDGMPMVVLVNSDSASAAEIVAGCLQDRGRAVIMGEKTFGKGSVQSIIPLRDGSALRLTTAKYYTPSHKVIHGEGITPDCVVPMSDDDERALAMRQRRPSLDSLSAADRKLVTDNHDEQLDRAIDQLKGVLIFTGRSPEGSQKVAEKVQSPRQ